MSSNKINSDQLNILFIKGQSFPNGFAMARRHRYIVDYLNSQNISSGLIQTRTNTDPFDNPVFGIYGLAKYLNANYFWHKRFVGKINYFVKVVSFIYKHYDKSKRNIIVFPSILYIDLIPFFLFAKILGYSIVYDIVENYNATGVVKSTILKISSILSKKLYKRSSGIFVISSQLKKYINTLAPKVPICILPNSSPIASLNKKGKFSNPIRILYSGTFAPKDGLEYLVEAYKVFCEKTNSDSELILTGGRDEKDVNYILNLAKDCEHIHYKGFVSDAELQQIITSSDILTMTRCNSEFANYGFPFKLSEYLASGNTVLATKVGDVPLYLKHKENAFLIEPESISEIVNALEYLVQNENESIKIGKKGQDVVMEKFDVNANGKVFVDFIVKCIGK